MFQVKFKNSEKTLLVPAELLSKYSSFFKDTYDEGEWRSDGTMEVLLGKGTPDIFAMLMTWLYHGGRHEGIEFWKPLEEDECVGHRGNDLLVAIWNMLVDAYLLMEYLRAPMFNNSIIESMIRLLEQREEHGYGNSKLEWPDVLFTPEAKIQTIHRVWNEASTLSPLRRLIVDHLVYSRFNHRPDQKRIYTNSRPNDAGMQLKLNVPADFFWTWIAKLQVAARDEYDASCPWDRDPCLYHSHERFGPCDYPKISPNGKGNLDYEVLQVGNLKTLQ